MDFSDDNGEKKKAKKIHPDKSDPEITPENLVLYRDLLHETLNEKLKSSCVFKTQVRFEVGHKTYGARFIAFVLEKLVAFGILSKEQYDDCFWSLTFADFMQKIDQLITTLQGNQAARSS
jgi:hypothetical protein